MEAASLKSFSKSCLAIDGQFYGEDKVGFYCLTKNVEQFEYMYSMCVPSRSLREETRVATDLVVGSICATASPTMSALSSATRSASQMCPPFLKAEANAA